MGLFLARRVSMLRAVLYMLAQCLGAIAGVGLVKAFMKSKYNRQGGGVNVVNSGYNTGTALGAEIIGTFVLVYTVFSATDPKRSARDSHVPVSTRLTHLFLTPTTPWMALTSDIFLLWCRFWLHFQLDLQCSWFTWPQSPSQELASTRPGASELLSSRTQKRLGMTTYVLDS